MLHAQYTGNTQDIEQPLFHVSENFWVTEEACQLASIQLSLPPVSNHVNKTSAVSAVYHAQLTLNTHLNCTGPLICRFFSIYVQLSISFLGFASTDLAVARNLCAQRVDLNDTVFDFKGDRFP